MIVSRRIIDILREAEANTKRRREEERLAAEAAANQTENTDDR